MALTLTFFFPRSGEVGSKLQTNSPLTVYLYKPKSALHTNITCVTRFVSAECSERYSGLCCCSALVLAPFSGRAKRSRPPQGQDIVLPGVLPWHHSTAPLSVRGRVTLAVAGPRELPLAAGCCQQRHEGMDTVEEEEEKDGAAEGGREKIQEGTNENNGVISCGKKTVSASVTWLDFQLLHTQHHAWKKKMHDSFHRKQLNYLRLCNILYITAAHLHHLCLIKSQRFIFSTSLALFSAITYSQSKLFFVPEYPELLRSCGLVFTLCSHKAVTCLTKAKAALSLNVLDHLFCLLWFCEKWLHDPNSLTQQNSSITEQQRNISELEKAETLLINC